LTSSPEKTVLCGWRKRRNPAEVRTRPRRGRFCEEGGEICPVKPFSGTGREHGHPAEVRTRPPPRCDRVLSANQMNRIQREEVQFWNSLSRRELFCAVGEQNSPNTQILDSRRKLFCVGGGRASPGHHPHKTLSMHGARTPAPRQGADPSAAEVLWSLFSQVIIGHLDKT